MGTGILTSLDVLKKIDQARNSLICVNNNIRRVIGRSPRNTSIRERKRKNEGRAEVSYSSGRNIRSPDLPFFKTCGSNKIEISGKQLKPRLNSRIIRELPTRQDILAAQGIDAQSRERNRRIFGSLIGTLKKFCQEETKMKHKEEKKAKVEKKLEQQETREREILKKEKEFLIFDRKQKQLEIRKLELKMDILQDYEIWEKSQICCNEFILTRSNPKIYYRPKTFGKTSSQLLNETQIIRKDQIEKKRGELNDNLFKIDDEFHLSTACEQEKNSHTVSFTF